MKADKVAKIIVVGGGLITVCWTMLCLYLLGLMT